MKVHRLPLRLMVYPDLILLPTPQPINLIYFMYKITIRSQFSPLSFVVRRADFLADAVLRRARQGMLIGRIEVILDTSANQIIALSLSDRVLFQQLIIDLSFSIQIIFAQMPTRVSGLVRLARKLRWHQVAAHFPETNTLAAEKKSRSLVPYKSLGFTCSSLRALLFATTLSSVQRAWPR